MTIKEETIEEIVNHLDDVACEEISVETKDIWRLYLRRKLVLAGFVKRKKHRKKHR